MTGTCQKQIQHGHVSVFLNFDFIPTLKENFSLEQIDLVLDTFSHQSSHLEFCLFFFRFCDICSYILGPKSKHGTHLHPV